MKTASAITAVRITEAVQTENALLMPTATESVITVTLIIGAIQLTAAVRAMLMKTETVSATTMKTRLPATPTDAAAITVPGAGTADKRNTLCGTNKR